MYRIYTHAEESHDKVEVVHDLDDPDVDAWVCAPGHPDRAIFDAAGADVVYDTVQDAFDALIISDVELVAASEAWQRKEGKNKNGGLNDKGRASYNRTHKGSLKRPVPRGPRHKSFCERMRGMKRKLTSKKVANDPNSRINKALRAWKC